jgi:cell division protein FtsW
VAAIPCFVVAVIMEPYRIRRLLAFIDPEADIHNHGYHLYQSMVAIGSGGLWGQGLGCGLQKYLFLSEAHTDFIFAVVCEEMGMIGALVIIGLYSFLIVQGIRVATKVPDMFGALIAAGVTVMIGLQAFINMGVVVGLLPTKGLTLPLISYGGSSLMINAIAIGIMMNVSRHAEYAVNPPQRMRLSYA